MTNTTLSLLSVLLFFAVAWWLHITRNDDDSLR